jgi:hypothetical protein
MDLLLQPAEPAPSKLLQTVIPPTRSQGGAARPFSDSGRPSDGMKTWYAKRTSREYLCRLNSDIVKAFK